MMVLQSEERRAAEIIFARNTGGTADPNELGASLRALRGLKLSLDSYIALTYTAHNQKRRTVHDAMDLITKVLGDFGYAPVELLSLLTDILGDVRFKDAAAARREYVINLHTALRQRFERAYPKGTYSD